MTSSLRPFMSTEHVDVLIVGAGISGVDAAYGLTERCPGRSFVILERSQSYPRDRRALLREPLEDDALEFARVNAREPAKVAV